MGAENAKQSFTSTRRRMGRSPSREMNTAEVFHGQKGVCRDFAHLGISLCRALGIPAGRDAADVAFSWPHAGIGAALGGGAGLLAGLGPETLC